MNFLAPLFLLGALAIAGPVIFHLIRRTTKDRQRFGSLMFLDPTPPRLTKRSRIEHWLLLLLRAAALALLALAFARPFFRSSVPQAPAGGAGKRTVVLVDTSASMRRAGLWDQGTEQALEAAENSSPGDVAIVAFDRATTTLLSFDDWRRAAPEARLALARERLSAVTPSWSGTNVASALMAAAEMLSESSPGSTGEREIVLVSDAQEGSRLDALQGYEWPKNIVVHIKRLTSTKPGNAGVQLAADSDTGTADAVAGARLRVNNSSDAGSESFQLGWRAAGGDFAGRALDVYVPPGQSRIVVLPWPESGPQPGSVMLRGDTEDFDNIVAVAPQPPEAVTVIHSGAADEPRGPLSFLRKAMPEGRFLKASVEHHASGDLPAADTIKSSPLWVITAPVDPPVAAAAGSRVAGGGTALVMLHSPDMASTVQAVTGCGPLSLTLANPASHGLLGNIDFGHPLFAAFAEPRFSDFTKIRFWNYCRIDAAALPGAKVLASFDSGDPAVLEVPREKGRVFLLAAGWQPDASQLALSSKFPALLASLLATTGAGARLPVQYFAGEDGFTEPGLQKTTKDGQTRDVAVNLDPAESRTAPLPVEEFEKMGAPVAAAARSKEPPNAAAESLAAAAEAEGRQKIWRWLLAAVLAVLFIETLLGIRTARRYSQPEGEIAS